MRRVIIIATGLVIAILAACDKYTIPTPPCEDGAENVSFSGDLQPIFNSNCISCHSGGQSPDLREGWSYDELVNGVSSTGEPYVAEPEFACESILYQVFFGSHDGRASDDEILQILGWIQEGAQDN